MCATWMGKARGIRSRRPKAGGQFLLHFSLYARFWKCDLLTGTELIEH